MGKGLSPQQRRILGLGRACNAAIHGGSGWFPELDVVEPGDEYRMPVVDHDPATAPRLHPTRYKIPAVVGPAGFPEVTHSFCLLALDGMRFETSCVRVVEPTKNSPYRREPYETRCEWRGHGLGGHFDNKQPGYASRKASTFRAIAALCARRLLVYQPKAAMDPARPRHCRLLSSSWSSDGCDGYRLTPEGAEEGKGFEPELSPADLQSARRRLVSKYEDAAIAALNKASRKAKRKASRAAA